MVDLLQVQFTFSDLWSMNLVRWLVKMQKRCSGQLQARLLHENGGSAVVMVTLF